ncbi:hypothetical protein QA089_001274 [Meyerozyma guilliermondii]
MGSCISKDASDVKVQPKSHKVSEKEVTGTSRLAQTKQNKSQGHVLGGTSQSENEARLASAKAAEERYERSQRKLSEGNDKLKKLSKMSRADKGL